MQSTLYAEEHPVSCTTLTFHTKEIQKKKQCQRRRSEWYVPPEAIKNFGVLQFRWWTLFGPKSCVTKNVRHAKLWFSVFFSYYYYYARLGCTSNSNAFPFGVAMFPSIDSCAATLASSDSWAPFRKRGECVCHIEDDVTRWENSETSRNENTLFPPSQLQVRMLTSILSFGCDSVAHWAAVLLGVE